MNDITLTKMHGLVEINHKQFKTDSAVYKQQITHDWLQSALNTPTSNHTLVESLRDNLSKFGKAEELAFWELNKDLKHPLEKLIREAKNNEIITKSLHQLQSTIIKIKPPKQTFWGKFKSMFTLLFSLKESSWHLWMDSYPTHKKHILKVTGNLEKYKKQLHRDNSSLLNDKSFLQAREIELENSFDILSYIEKKASNETVSNPELETDLNNLFCDELIPAIQTRLIELQQQLIIARQSIMTWELFISQNKSQIKSIDQAIHTTANAIEVTASIYMLKQKSQLTQQSDQSNKQSLIEARDLIDQALTHVDKINQSQNNNTVLDK